MLVVCVNVEMSNLSYIKYRKGLQVEGDPCVWYANRLIDWLSKHLVWMVECWSTVGFYLQSEADKVLQDRITKLHTILGGDTTIALHLQFLIRTNKTDLLILKNTKVKHPRSCLLLTMRLHKLSFYHCSCIVYELISQDFKIIRTVVLLRLVTNWWLLRDM